MDFAGSIPLAISAAAISRTLEPSSFGSTSTVSAWRSARKNRHSASSCIRTQRRIAPSRLPKCKPPVGWIPEAIRTLDGLGGIVCGPFAAEQKLEFLAIRAAEDPDQRKIDDHPAADDCDHSGEAMRQRADEPPAERAADREQRDDHCGRREQLPGKTRSEPLLDPEMPTPVKQDVEDRAVEP